MNYSSLTHTELERHAFISGDSATSNLLAQVDDTQTTIKGLEEKLSDVENDAKSFKKWEKRNGPASDYYDFFHECFTRLSGAYPCPSVTSDYDKSIIFEAIENGEKVEDLQNEITILKGEIEHMARQLLRYEG